MNDKQQILSSLREEFSRWEALLAGLSEAQITAPHLPSNWSIKDVVAHLWAWPQLSIAWREGFLRFNGCSSIILFPIFSIYPYIGQPQAVCLPTPYETDAVEQRPYASW